MCEKSAVTAAYTHTHTQLYRDTNADTYTHTYTQTPTHTATYTHPHAAHKWFWLPAFLLAFLALFSSAFFLIHLQGVYSFGPKVRNAA